MTPIQIRNAEPSDYEPVISVLNDWWGGRDMRNMLPKLFFVHFRKTTFVAEEGGQLVGFLAGFVSQTFPQEAYVHFLGVHPHFRRKCVGRFLYQHVFSVVSELGCNVVRCVTSPVNTDSVRFHLRMGFTMEPSEAIVDGFHIARNYDGQGEDRVLLVRRLDRSGRP